MKKAVHYLNQFFGGIGGEDKADFSGKTLPGTIGPGMKLKDLLASDAEIVATFICGDNYFSAENETALANWRDFLRQHQPDLVIAGPCFDAGRYGLACAGVAAAAEELGIPTVIGMFEANPAREVMMGRRLVYGVPTANRATKMNDALANMAAFAKKLLAGQDLGSAREGGYIPRGIRKNVHHAQTGADRMVDMLLAKLAGKAFYTDVELPAYEIVPPAPPMVDLARGRLALVTEGGLVPAGNPDRIESARATRWQKYQITGKDKLSGGDYFSIHGGYDTANVNQDPCRMIPLDAMRVLEQARRYQTLDDYFYTYCGMAAPIASAVQFGALVADSLVEARVDGVILTAT